VKDRPVKKSTAATTDVLIGQTSKALTLSRRRIHRVNEAEMRKYSVAARRSGRLPTTKVPRGHYLLVSVTDTPQVPVVYIFSWRRSAYYTRFIV